MSDRNVDMNDIEPHWWALIGVAVAGFLGWRLSSAQDAVRIQALTDKTNALAERLNSLENGTVTTASTLATLTAHIEAISNTLSRVERKLDEKVDK